MGKLLRQQRRGKGSFAYKANSHRYKADLCYKKQDDIEKTGKLRGQIIDFIDDPGRAAVLMEVLFEDGSCRNYLAPEGARLGGEIFCGAKSDIEVGNCLPLSKIPEGSMIFNIEINPSDGGKLIRAPGSYAVLVSKEKQSAYVKLPSKQTIILNENCRAQIGVVSGGGRLEKPLMKAGANHYKKHAQNRKWPVNRGVHMCAYTHPFGGKQHHKGRSSMTSRNAPPGRKVGHIAAKSVGRKKSNVEEGK